MRNSRMNSITQICRQKCIFNKVTSRKNGEVKIQEKLKDQGKPQNLLLSFQEALPSAQVNTQWEESFFPKTSKLLWPLLLFFG